ncbi:MAG: SUMF1/EgtB/PvdO family nonheme iron enzyme [Labilithrix sp.]|nr:SUMF1/EgtB/PvdO family nonheme iron enzyme [Labilithrix sp.]MBX3220033.1 SUMF1/EgtB/PvdO family nonheme iron enzyme [Labilithrix sp.]
MRGVAGIFGGVALAAALVRCSSFESVPGDAGADASELDDAPALDEARPDAPADAPLDAGRCDSGCPGSGGPCAVRAGPTCIDATEVTVADFRAFTESVQGTTLEVGAPCPPVTVGLLGARPDESLPMTQVSFCEARAFCAWAGKRLCGKVGGGPIPTTGPSSGPTTQQAAWFNACTGGTADPHPLLSDGGCQLGASGPRAAGSGCQGGVRGLVDMVGNVWEWIEYVGERDGATPAVFMIGGGYGHPPTSTTCGSLVQATLPFRGPDVGFRCCSP